MASIAAAVAGDVMDEELAAASLAELRLLGLFLAEALLRPRCGLRGLSAVRALDVAAV